MPNYQGDYGTPRLELGAAVMEFMQTQEEFVGSQVLPIFNTPKKKATFPAITRESLTRDADTKRAPRAEYNRDGYEAKDKNYSCEEHGLEGQLDDSERELYKNDFDAELVTTRTVARRVMQAQEKRVSNLVFNTSTFTGSSLYTTHASSPWSANDSDAIDQVRQAKEKVRQNCGMKANALVISETNKERLKALDVVKESIKYVARLTDSELENALKDLFGVKYLIVAGGIRNTAKEGKAFSGADIWSSDYAMVARIVENSEDLSDPGLGRIFLWSEDSPENPVVEQYREEKTRSDVFRVRHHVDEQIIDPYFGHLLRVTA